MSNINKTAFTSQCKLLIEYFNIKVNSWCSLVTYNHNFLTKVGHRTREYNLETFCYNSQQIQRYLQKCAGVHFF